MSTNNASFLRVSGSHIVDADGTPVTLFGIGVGGWLNMENWITGFPGYEEGARAAVGQVLGPGLRDFFFDRFLEHFFTADDAAYLASLGINMIRLPFSYKYLESDDAPFEINENGFRYLDRVIEQCAAHGIRTVLDLHTVPGWQHQDWHCDNPSHTAQFWVHRTFQDRVVHLWRAIAARYKDNPWVAGYNPINEPADPSAAKVGPFYQRLVEAIREIDQNHILFLDGNRYALDFHFFGEPWPNTVYCPHDYPAPGYTPGSRYPGRHQPIHVLNAGDGRTAESEGEAYWDKDEVERSFLYRTVYMRETGTPIVVGEFNAVWPDVEQERLQLLSDQLDVFRKYNASWTYWSYKDVGFAAPLRLAPDGAYMERIRPILDKKARLAVDLWGGDRRKMSHVLGPIHQALAQEAPNWNPYPWGSEFMVCRVVLQILFSEALLPEFGELFRGMNEDDIDQMMRSFRLENCQPWQPLVDMLRRDIAARRHDAVVAA
ncbi:glycoside hydrolase family 5 protein [Actinomycetes bacterium KLBMP 9797]